MALSKSKWKEEHLSKLHTENQAWCPLCRARELGEANPPQHLVPPHQDPSQQDMDYVKPDYKPDDAKYYANIIQEDEQ